MKPLPGTRGLRQGARCADELHLPSRLPLLALIILLPSSLFLIFSFTITGAWASTPHDGDTNLIVMPSGSTATLSPTPDCGAAWRVVPAPDQSNIHNGLKERCSSHQCQRRCLGGGQLQRWEHSAASRPSLGWHSVEHEPDWYGWHRH